MAEIELTQAEADALTAMEKHRVGNDSHEYPALGGKLSMQLVSADGRENFTLDIARGRINLSKSTYQTRARHVIVLVRLDLGGPPHRNPDGQEMPCPHLHVYREGYGHKYAIPLPIEDFPDIENAWATLGHFMDYCNITVKPYIEPGLFT